MRVGNVAGTAGLHRNSAPAVTAHGHDDAFTKNRGAVDERIQAAAKPQRLTGLRIVAADLLGPRHHQLFAPARADDQRDAPRADDAVGFRAKAVAARERDVDLRNFLPPDVAAGALLHGEKEDALAGAKIEIAKIAVK